MPAPPVGSVKGTRLAPRLASHVWGEATCCPRSLKAQQSKGRWSRCWGWGILEPSPPSPHHAPPHVNRTEVSRAEHPLSADTSAIRLAELSLHKDVYSRTESEDCLAQDSGSGGNRDLQLMAPRVSGCPDGVFSVTRPSRTGLIPAVRHKRGPGTISEWTGIT